MHNIEVWCIKFSFCTQDECYTIRLKKAYVMFLKTYYRRGPAALLLCILLLLQSCQSYLNITDDEVDMPRETEGQQEGASNALVVTPSTPLSAVQPASQDTIFCGFPTVTKRLSSSALFPPFTAVASPRQDDLLLPELSGQQEEGNKPFLSKRRRTTGDNAFTTTLYTNDIATRSYDVFISHAGEDKIRERIAVPLHAELERRGLRTFLDKEEEIWEEQHDPSIVETAMETALCGIFILSPEFIAREWPMKELSYFLRRHKEARDKGEVPPLLVPILHGLMWPDYKMCPRAFFSKYESYFTEKQSGFLRRLMAKKTSTRQIMAILQDLRQIKFCVGAESEKYDHPIITEVAKKIHRKMRLTWPTSVKPLRDWTSWLYDYTAHAKKIPHYIERYQETGKLREVLARQGICVLHGYGGSGKSTLAHYYARSDTQFSEQQIEWFVSSDSAEKIQAAFQSMAGKLDIDYKVLMEIWKPDLRRYRRELSRAVYDALEENGQCLFLILDNAGADDGEPIKDFISQRPTHRTKIIITTRNPIAFPNYEKIALSDFLLEEGIAYVEQGLAYMWDSFPQSNKEAFSAVVRHLVKVVGLTPLKLDLAINFLQQNRLYTIPRYTEELQGFKASPDILLRPSTIPEVDMRLATLDKLSQQVMRYSTSLSVDFIPFTLLGTLLEEPAVDNIKKILQPLERLSLVTVIVEELGIKIHQSVQESCQAYSKWCEGADFSEAALLGRLVAALSGIMAWTESSPDVYWGASRLYAPHVSRVLMRAVDVLGESTTIASCLDLMGKHQEEVACDYQQALACFEQALEIRQKFYGEVLHPDVARSLNKVGKGYHALGDVQKGLYYQEQGLTILQTLYKKSPHPDIASSLHNVSKAYQALGDIQKGIIYQKKALSIYQGLYGEELHPNMAMSLNNIGMAYQKLGNRQESLSYFEDALAMYQTIYEEEPHPDVASSMSNVGEAYEMLGSVQDGLYYQEYALTMRQKLYRELPHPDVANSLHNVGRVYQTLGDVQKALTYQEQALTMRQKLYSEKPHPDVASSLNSVGMIHETLGDIQKDLTYQEQALAILQALYGEVPHSDVAMSLHNIGAAYEKLGETQKGLTYQEHALTMRQHLHREAPHADLASSLHDVGVAYEKLGALQKGLNYQEQALTMFKAIYEKSPHPNVASSLYNVGLAYETLGEIEKAKQYFKEGLAVSQKLDAAVVTFYTQEFIQKLLYINYEAAAVAYQQQDVAGAIHYYEEALEMLAEMHGDLKQAICHNLGCMYHIKVIQANKAEDSKMYSQKAIDAFDAAMASSDTPQVDVMTEYANFLIAIKELPRAHSLLTCAIDSGDGASELGYGLLEQATVSPLLQRYIIQDGHVQVQGMDYAYYLLLYHYEAFVQAGIKPDKTYKDYLDDYKEKIKTSVGQPGKEKQDALAKFLLDSLCSQAT